MAAIHYKFSSSNSYKNITFDGLNISLLDLKKSIMEKEKLKNTEGDLQITNAQSMQVYKDESSLIPKNTSVLVRRAPLGVVKSSITYVVKKPSSIASVSASTKSDATIQANKLTLEQLTKTNDLTTANASEDDKIKAMMSQATNEYDPSNFVRQPRYGTYPRNNTPQLPSYIRCHKCNQTGHYATQCPVKLDSDKWKSVRHATGIPRSQMIQVSKETRGAMLTSDGKYVVPVIDKAGYAAGKKEAPPFLPPTVVEKVEEDDEPVPDELMCLLCKELLQDAVVIPCCGNSYCDECIRNELLESEDHQCPTCHKKNISPDSLIANKFLRQAVNKFKNDTGVTRKNTAQVWPRPANVETPKPKPVATQPTKVSYGPPSKVQYGQPKKPTGAYVVKAKSSQVYSVPVTSKYVVKTMTAAPVNTTTATSMPIPTTSSVNDTTFVSGIPTATDETNESKPILKSSVPIRIKLEAQEPQPRISQNQSPKPDQDPDPDQDASDNAITPSTTVESSSAQSSVSKEDSYTVHSTPESDPKVKSLKPQPLPPGVSPPVPKVIRTLEEKDEEKDQISNEKGSEKISGIEPLPPVQSESAKEDIGPTPTKDEKDDKINTTTTTEELNDKSIESEKISPFKEVSVKTGRRSPLLETPPPSVLTIPTTRPLLHNLPNPAPPFPPPGRIRISIPPPPMNMPPGLRLPPGMPGMPPPPHMFPPGIPPPGFLPPGMVVGPPGVDPPPLAPPNLLPPGTGPAPSMPLPPLHGRHHRHNRDRRRSRGRRDDDRPRSKLDLMSDEFTKKINRRKVIRRRRRSSTSQSETDSSSSQSGSYSGSESSSSNSKSPSPVKKRGKSKRTKKRKEGSDSERSWSGNVRSESYSPSRSPSKGRISKRHREEKKSRHSRSPNYHSRRHQTSRSPIRHRRHSPLNEYPGQVVPGMPPQDVLDFQRDQALYDYYKQKYERDWIRHRIYPPSPFKRFINYDPRQPLMQVPVYLQGDATPTEEDAGLIRFQDRTPEEYRDRRFDNSSWEPQGHEQRPREEYFENGGRRGREKYDKRNWHKAPEYDNRDRYDRRKGYSQGREKQARSKYDERRIEFGDENARRDKRKSDRDNLAKGDFESSSSRKHKHDDRMRDPDRESRKRGRDKRDYDVEVVDRKRRRDSHQGGGVNENNMIQIKVVNDKRITKTITNDNVHIATDDEADPLDAREYQDDIYLQDEKPEHKKHEKTKRKEKCHRKSKSSKERSDRKKSLNDEEKKPKQDQTEVRVEEPEEKESLLQDVVEKVASSQSPPKQEEQTVEKNDKPTFIPIPFKEPSPVRESVRVLKTLRGVKPVVDMTTEVSYKLDALSSGDKVTGGDSRKITKNIDNSKVVDRLPVSDTSKRVPSPITAPGKSKSGKVKVKRNKSIKIKKVKKEKKESLKTLVPVDLPKSKWDSDTGSPDRKPVKARLGKKAVTGTEENDISKSSKTKKRRIKIKQPDEKNDKNHEKQNIAEKALVPDSRRVVVSGNGKPLSRQSSIITSRPSISSIVDESFQPTYSERSVSDHDDALSTFADSDFGDLNSKKEEKRAEEEVVVKPKKKKKKKKHKKNKGDTVEEKSSQNDDPVDSDSHEHEKKKKKNKKDKNKKPSSKTKKKQKIVEDYSSQNSPKMRHKKVDYSDDDCDSETNYDMANRSKTRKVQVKDRLGFTSSKRGRVEPAGAAFDDQSDDSDFGHHRDYDHQPSKKTKHIHKNTNRMKQFKTYSKNYRY